MDLDSSWHCGGMAADVYKELLLEEHCLPHFTASSKFTKMRRSVIDWMIVVGKNLVAGKRQNQQPFKLCSTTMHLAVLLFDVFLERDADMDANHVFLSASVSLIVAAKIEEQDAYIPKVSTINRHLEMGLGPGYGYPVKSFAAWERKLLKLMHFRFMLPTAPLFIPYYLTMASDDLNEEGYRTPDCSILRSTSSDDFLGSAGTNSTGRNDLRSSSWVSVKREKTQTACSRDSGFWSPNEVQYVQMMEGNLPQLQPLLTPSPEPKPTMTDSLQQMVDFYLELLLKDAAFQQWRPSLTAGACVAAARQRLHLNPCWPVALETLTSYSLKQLEPCLISLHQLALEVPLSYGYGLSMDSPEPEAQWKERQTMVYQSFAAATRSRENSVAVRHPDPLLYANSMPQLHGASSTVRFRRAVDKLNLYRRQDTQHLATVPVAPTQQQQPQQVVFHQNGGVYVPMSTHMGFVANGVPVSQVRLQFVPGGFQQLQQLYQVTDVRMPMHSLWIAQNSGRESGHVQQLVPSTSSVGSSRSAAGAEMQIVDQSVQRRGYEDLAGNFIQIPSSSKYCMVLAEKPTQQATAVQQSEPVVITSKVAVTEEQVSVGRRVASKRRAAPSKQGALLRKRRQVESDVVLIN